VVAVALQLELMDLTHTAKLVGLVFLLLGMQSKDKNEPFC
tara:strand:+ start:280 stop:399 length:120 start_codon:yes stop_codon:yes gene_type:complete